MVNQTFKIPPVFAESAEESSQDGTTKKILQAAVDVFREDRDEIAISRMNYSVILGELKNLEKGVRLRKQGSEQPREGFKHTVQRQTNNSVQQRPNLLAHRLFDERSDVEQCNGNECSKSNVSPDARTERGLQKDFEKKVKNCLQVNNGNKSPNLSTAREVSTKDRVQPATPTKCNPDPKAGNEHLILSKVQEIHKEGERRNVHTDICLQPLSRNEEKKWEFLVRSVPDDKKVTFIKEANISLNGEQFKRLLPDKWLDDEVINSFCALLNSRNVRYRLRLNRNNTDTPVGDDNSSVPPKGLASFRLTRPRVYVFFTQFFTLLSKPHYDYNNVKRWRRKACRNQPVSSFDLLLFPINKKDSHWILAAINLRRKQFVYFDSLQELDMDNTLGTLQRWLIDEVMDTAGRSAVNNMDINSWTFLMNPSFAPRQCDSSSCGIFMLYLAYFLEQGKRPIFSQKGIQILRKRTALFLEEGKLPDE